MQHYFERRLDMRRCSAIQQEDWIFAIVASSNRNTGCAPLQRYSAGRMDIICAIAALFRKKTRYAPLQRYSERRLLHLIRGHRRTVSIIRSNSDRGRHLEYGANTGSLSILARLLGLTARCMPSFQLKHGLLEYQELKSKRQNKRRGLRSVARCGHQKQ